MSQERLKVEMSQLELGIEMSQSGRRDKTSWPKTKVKMSHSGPMNEMSLRVTIWSKWRRVVPNQISRWVNLNWRWRWVLLAKGQNNLVGPKIRTSWVGPKVETSW